jgi:hypothetical protein
MLYKVLFVLMVVGCGESLPRNSLIVSSGEPTPELRQACSFTEQKCTRCHTIGRVIAWDARTREQWEPLVTRMRQMVSSGITKEDAEVVLDCLGHRDDPPRHARTFLP